MVISRLKSFLKEEIPIESLVFFRVAFGLLMIVGQIRFISNNWIEELYVQPNYFFKYYGFEWVVVPGEFGLYLLYGLTVLSALMIALGYFYRLFAIVFFLSFTYLELLDVTNYLNHYVFISLVSFVIIFLPLNRSHSLDVRLRGLKAFGRVQRKFFYIILLCIGGLYLVAGLAKLNYSWLFEAFPMRIWLHPQSTLPIIGPLMDELWVAYLFSWLGAIYDISIPFLLFFRKTRPIALLTVFCFHALTAIFFPIGMFPYIMITFSLLFLNPESHRRIILFFSRSCSQSSYKPSVFIRRSFVPVTIVAVFFLFIFPLRSHLYKGDVFWTEQGYRFSWRVMLMEKMGHCYFFVKDPNQPGQKEVRPSTYLTPNQERHMSRQPDLILQMAKIIENDYVNRGIENPEVRVESWVSLNGRGSQLFIDPSVDLTKIEDNWKHKNWIIPLDSIITPRNYRHNYYSHN